MKFDVVRAFDNGIRERVRAGLTYDQADALAGRMRDSMTDDECAMGFNYLPMRGKGASNGKVSNRRSDRKAKDGAGRNGLPRRMAE